MLGPNYKSAEVIAIIIELLYLLDCMEKFDMSPDELVAQAHRNIARRRAFAMPPQSGAATAGGGGAAGGGAAAGGATASARLGGGSLSTAPPSRLVSAAAGGGGGGARAPLRADPDCGVACTACTFNNATDVVKCEICGASLPIGGCVPLPPAPANGGGAAADAIPADSSECTLCYNTKKQDKFLCCKNSTCAEVNKTCIDCIGKWMGTTVNPTCPFCRTEI